MSTIQTPLKGIPFGGKAPKQPPVSLATHPAGPGTASAAGFTESKGLGLATEESLEWADDQVTKAAPPLPEPLCFRLGSSVLQGHLASDPQHGSYPSTRQAIRSYMPMADGQVAALGFRELLQAVQIPSPPSKTYVVKGSQVDQAVRETGAERQKQLKSGQMNWGRQVVPKDATLNPTDVTMYLRSSSDVSSRYAAQLAEVGKMEGFHVVAGIGSGQTATYQNVFKGVGNLSLMEIPHGEVWVEDYSEPTLGGGQVAPAIFDDPGGRFVHDAITEGRRQRFAGTGLDGSFAYHGAVNQGKYQKAALARGIAEMGPLRQALSYLEGGNIYTGTRPNGEGYVLVGKDSFHVSRRLLENQTGRKWSEAEVAKAIAADLGLKPQNVVPVEQPGAFHLDMRMSALGPGEILLHDSVAAANQQIAWMRDDVNKKLAAGEITAQQAAQQMKTIDAQGKNMLAQARRMAPYEEISARDLRAAGFEVHRLAASFVDPKQPSRDTANYFNARHGTNEQGERFSILMGGRSREEAYVAQQMFALSDGTLSRVHFLDPAVTQSTLDLMGGLKCRTKPEGDLISRELLASPPQAVLQLA
jgi:hypothetical protein